MSHTQKTSNKPTSKGITEVQMLCTVERAVTKMPVVSTRCGPVIREPALHAGAASTTYPKHTYQEIEEIDVPESAPEVPRLDAPEARTETHCPSMQSVSEPRAVVVASRLDTCSVAVGSKSRGVADCAPLRACLDSSVNPSGACARGCAGAGSGCVLGSDPARTGDTHGSQGLFCGPQAAH